MEWRAARDGLRLFVIANVVHAVAIVAGTAVSAIASPRGSTPGAPEIIASVVVSACTFVELVAAIAIARVPRGTPGRGLAAAWAVMAVVAFVFWAFTPLYNAAAPDGRRSYSIIATSVWAVEVGLFLAAAATISRARGALFAVTALAIAARAASFAVSWFVDMPALFRGLVPPIIYLAIIAMKLVWLRRIAAVIPARPADGIELAGKSRDVARHTLALFRRGFTLRVAATYAFGLAITIAAGVGGYHVAAVLGVVYAVALVGTSSILLIALGGWAVVGGGFAKAAGWLAVLDFVFGLAWIAIVIFDISLGELANVVGRIATVLVGVTAPLAFALSIASVAATDALAKDARRVAWTIGGFVVALGVAIVVIVAPIRPSGDLARAALSSIAQTIPGIVIGTSSLVALYLFWLVRTAQNAVDADAAS